jgi:Sulfotransferase family
VNAYHPLPFEKFDRIVDTSVLRSSLGMRIGEAHSLIQKMKVSGALIANDYQRIYFHHVRKTAGTSIAYAFYGVAGDPYTIEEQLKYFRFAARSGYRYVGLNPRLIAQGDYFFASSHLPNHEISLPRCGTFSFTVLRDPMERVISLYRYLSNPKADRLYASAAFDHEHAWAADGFESFLERVPKNHLLNQLYMFSRTGSVEEAVNALEGLSCVIRTETLTDDILGLQSRLGIPIQVGVERKSDHLVDLSRLEIDRLREMTESEYAMIGRLKR